MANVISNLQGYETIFGNKKAMVLDRACTASYNTTTGDVLNASDIGWGGIDWANVLGTRVETASGTYYGIARQVGTSTTNPGLTNTSLAIHMYTTSSATEVGSAANLSAETLRLFLVGV